MTFRKVGLVVVFVVRRFFPLDVASKGVPVVNLLGARVYHLPPHTPDRLLGREAVCKFNVPGSDKKNWRGADDTCKFESDAVRLKVPPAVSMWPALDMVRRRGSGANVLGLLLRLRLSSRCCQMGVEKQKGYCRNKPTKGRAS